MPWRMPHASVVKAALPQRRRLSTVMASCTMSSASCVPSAFSSFQRDFSTRYDNNETDLQMLSFVSSIVYNNLTHNSSLSPISRLLKGHFFVCCYSLKAGSIASMISRCCLPLAVTSVVRLCIKYSCKLLSIIYLTLLMFCL